MKCVIPFVIFVCLCSWGWAENGDDELRVRTHLTGDWNGKRSAWEARGFTFDLTYTAEYFANVSGGIRDGGDFRGDLSLTLELDTSAAELWENGDFFVHLQEQHGHGVTERYVGDFQVLSNIDADDFYQVSEFWYRHRFLDSRLWLKVGKQESNEDFAFVEYGGEFINSSGGFHPTIPLTTFPDQDWGIVAGIEPVEWFSMNVGAYQGRGNGSQSIGNTIDALYGPMAMIEPAFHYTLGEKDGHFRLGYWFHGDNFERLDGTGETDGTDGFYVTFDQEVYRENVGDDEDGQGIGIFAQFGASDGEYFEAERYVGAGLQWTGAINGRDEDVLGAGIFHVKLSEEGGFAEDSETAYELFYKAQITPWFSMKPDVQIIVNPGGSGNSDAVVFGLRTELSF